MGLLAGTYRGAPTYGRTGAASSGSTARMLGRRSSGNTNGAAWYNVDSDAAALFTTTVSQGSTPLERRLPNPHWRPDSGGLQGSIRPETNVHLKQFLFALPPATHAPILTATHNVIDNDLQSHGRLLHDVPP